MEIEFVGRVNGGGRTGTVPASSSLRNIASVSNRSTEGVGGGVKRCFDAFEDRNAVQVETTRESESFSFLWTLKKYSLLADMDEVRSPTFHGGGGSEGGTGNHKWVMKITPMKMVEDKEYIAVHILLMELDGKSHADKKLTARFQISFLDEAGYPLKQGGGTQMNPCEFKVNSVWGYDKFLQKDEMKARGILKDDILRVHCRIWIEGPVTHKILKTNSGEELVRKHHTSLATDFGQLFKSTEGSDVTLVTSTGTEYKVHKAVLIARSPVFAATFKEYPELQKLEILESKDHILNRMLKFVYTGEMDIPADETVELLQIAEKYDVVGLKDNCEEEISLNLSIQNAAETMLLAYQCNTRILKERVVQFIKVHEEAVKRTPLFQKIARENPDVFVHLFLAC